MNEETLYDKLKGLGPDLSGYPEARLPNESEERFLEAYFEKVQSQAGCFAYIFYFIIVGLCGGGWIYIVAEEGLGLDTLIAGFVFFGIAWVAWSLGLPMAHRYQDTRLEEDQPLLLIEGCLRMDLRATGVGTKVYLDDVPVSVPTRWPKLYPSYVSAEVYPTNSGQHLIVSMRYKEEHRAAQASDEYRRKSHGFANGGAFSIAEDLERGKLEMGKKIYVLNA